ncbi:MAG: hypothetical protein SNJ52_00770 [Verrucomicrobiia bacterium]
MIFFGEQLLEEKANKSVISSNNCGLGEQASGQNNAPAMLFTRQKAVEHSSDLSGTFFFTLFA